MATPRGSTSEERYARLHGVQMADAVVFLVDWRLGMAQGMSPDGVPLLAEALQAIEALLRARVNASDRDLFGVVAFGAGVAGEVMKDSRGTWPGVRVVLPLERPDAEGIMKLQRLVYRLLKGDARRMAAGEVANGRDGHDFSFGEGPVEMHTALWAVRYQFMRKKIDTGASGTTIFNRQRCYVLTNDDDPVGGFADGGTGVRARAVSNAADLSEAGVSVEVTFLREDGGSAFDPSLFYSAIVYVDKDEYEEKRAGRAGINEEGIASAADLEGDFRGKLVKKRTTERIVLRLDKGLELGVALYAVVRKATRPQPVKVRRGKMGFEQVERVSTTLCDWSGKMLKKEEVRLNFDKLPFMASDLADAAARRAMEEEQGMLDEEEGEVESREQSADGESDDEGRDKTGGGGSEQGGGSSVAAPRISGFTHEELQEIGRIAGPPGLALYGFRDLDKLRREDIMQHPQFVYPDEKAINGSEKIFASLLDSMVRMRKMAIVLRTSDRGSSGPRFHALLPQAEVIDSRGLQTTAPGMHLIPLPWKNDVYTAWEGELKTLAKEGAEWEKKVLTSGGALGADDGGAGGGGGAGGSEQGTLRVVARKIVKRLVTKDYTVKDYTDPALDWYHAALEATVGVSKSFVAPRDSIKPDVDLMQKVIEEEGERYGVDLFERLNELTVGRGFNAEEIATLYGTKTGLKAKETAVRKLKRKAEKDAEAEAARVDLDEPRYVDAAKNGTLNTRAFTVAELKQYCKAFHLGPNGNKRQLAERVSDHINGPELDENVAL